MIAVVIGVVALLLVGGFLFVLSSVITQHNSEREEITGYFGDLLIQANLQFQTERDAWAMERASLLERIQRPDFIPPAPVPTEPEPANEIVDDLHLVGSIRDSETPPPPDDAA